jgi:hypothetical protein
MKCRKITNISNVLLPIKLKGGLSVYVPPGQSLESVEVEDFEQVKPFVSAEVDLAEVVPPKKGKQKIYG